MFFKMLILMSLSMSAWANEPTRTVDQMIGDYEAQKKQYAQFEQSLAVKNAQIRQDCKIWGRV
jgi:uncharacterized protein YbaP (TraB family)